MEPAPRNTSSLNRYACAGNISAALAGARDRYGNSACVVNGSTNGLCPQYGFDTSHNQINNTGYTYDASGDLSYDGNYTYHYDAEGRLIQVTQGSTALSTNTYDALGQEVRRVAPTFTVDLPVDPAGRMTAIFNEVGGWAEQELDGAGRHLGYYSSGNTYFLHRSNVGSLSPSQITDGAGALKGDETYYPYGQQWKYASEINSWWQSYGGFRRWQIDIGLYLSPNRFYPPTLGRWLTPDPLGGDIMNPQSLNRYSYVTNNPASMVDPLGLQGCSENPSDPGCIGVTSWGLNWWDQNPFFSEFNCGFFNICQTSGTGQAWYNTSNGGGGGGAAAVALPAGQPPQSQGSTCSAGNSSTSFGQYLSGVESAASMFGEFLTGTGPSDLTFGPGSVNSQMMASSPGITQAINAYNNRKPTGLYTFGLSGLWNAGANPIQQFVGSYRYSVVPTNGGLDVTLSNYTSVRSGSYHLLPSHQRSSFGPMGTTHQTYEVFVPCHP